MSRRWLWPAAVLLACSTLGCGERSVVPGPSDGPEEPVPGPAVRSDDGPSPPTPRLKPKTPQGKDRVAADKPLAREELRRLVARMAQDPPGHEVERIRETRPGSEIYIVSLSDSLVKDEDLVPLQEIPHVQVLTLSNCVGITSSGLVHLRPLRDDLQKLHLSRTAVDDRGLAHLRGMKQLEELNLYMTRVTGPGLAHLAGCQSLRKIYLQHTQVGDAGLAHLKSLSKLQEVLLDGTRVTEQGLRQFEAARPGVKLNHRLRRNSRSKSPAG